MTQEKCSRMVRIKSNQACNVGLIGTQWLRCVLPYLIAIVVVIYGLATPSVYAMPPGWTKGCLKPAYGSGEAACATGVDSPGVTFVFDPVGLSCNYFGPFG